MLKSIKINIFGAIILMVSICLPIQACAIDAEKEEIISFYMSFPKDKISITHSGQLNIPLYPEGTPKLLAYGKNRGLALLSHIRDADGNMIGFTSELEDFDSITETNLGSWKTIWTVTIPGKGSIIAYHIEALPPEVVEKFEFVTNTKKPWSGGITKPNTIGPLPNKRGIIIGGSGIYTGAKGEFIEIGTLHGLSAEGDLIADIELQFIIK